MPTTLNSGLQLPDKGSVDWYSSMQNNYNLLDTHLEDTDAHVTAEDKANWDSKQGSLSQAQLDAIAQVSTNTSDISALQSGKANTSHTHSSSDITDIGDYATKTYVDNSISGLVDSAPAALDTLKELSTALGDDANFASTVATALGNKANSADLATVATSGSYTDLSNKPNIPTVNDATLTIQKNGTTVNTFTANASSNVTANITVPTKTSDLTNDSNFVDTSNAAVASGITSAKVTSYDGHIADTDIHVTTADKTNWNGKADDSSVVHNSSDETINGVKTFTSLIRGYNSDSTQNTVSIDLRSSKVTRGNTQEGADTFGIGFRDKYNSALMSVSCIKRSTGTTTEYHTVNTLDNSDNVISASYSFNLNKDGTSSLQPEEDNQTFFGSSVKRWKSMYATNYYYGSDNTEFSTKFVTTDTAQTITSNKTFNGETRCVGELNQTVPFKMTSDTNFVIGTKNTRIYDQNGYQCGNEQIIYNNSKNIRRTWNLYNNSSGSVISGGFNFILRASGQKVFYPISDNDTDNGSSSAYWKCTYTKLINGTAPSGLSMPSSSGAIDISSYITDLSGTNVNRYTPLANGYIVIACNSTNVDYVKISSNLDFISSVDNTNSQFTSGNLGVWQPCLSGEEVQIRIKASALLSAKFYPCQGNI